MILIIRNLQKRLYRMVKLQMNVFNNNLFLNISFEDMISSHIKQTMISRKGADPIRPWIDRPVTLNEIYRVMSYLKEVSDP